MESSEFLKKRVHAVNGWQHAQHLEDVAAFCSAHEWRDYSFLCIDAISMI